MQSKTSAEWEVIPGETLRLVFKVPFLSAGAVAPIAHGFPEFVRWDGKLYVSVALRRGQPLTLSCSCHPNRQHFGWFVLIGKESAPCLELVSENSFEPVHQRTLLSLAAFRDEHSLVKALAW